MTPSRLPPTFRSLYRLLLRTASAAVLHQPTSARALRRLYRAPFEEAASVLRRPSPPSDADAAWMRTFEARMDNTLSLLYSSARSHGLGHQLTRNLTVLSRLEHHRAVQNRRAAIALLPRWNPRLAPNSLEYTPHPPPRDKRTENKEAKRARHRLMDDEVWSAFGEAVRLAEGRAGVILGRVPPLTRGRRPVYDEAR
ncbi:hypothetical protein PUNSTDRAFT_105383 [Punctularia strigosozonata HHB-11173 SS5]|uniref:uncharacterized protein n=1 Tax=Punctularia strigosozonata (strain HHB-11173) TaxID=741275 RepID=UPI0004416770|nr:uncharacterized protein PUNSTDRAFT_105383 [Punctularia strigosozonata HHB-11173 SS5]EIN06401.1 hypothetical protein PUNSTDRAFT_105383 [Punctularia strigosozonata HHB-11173 SS5]